MFRRTHTILKVAIFSQLLKVTIEDDCQCKTSCLGKKTELLFSGISTYLKTLRGIFLTITSFENQSLIKKTTLTIKPNNKVLRSIIKICC